MIGIGLLYTEGYFTQYLNLDGWQQEKYPENDFYNMPMTRVAGEDGAPVFTHVEFPDGICTVAKRESSPLREEESIGTPITGRMV